MHFCELCIQPGNTNYTLSLKCRAPEVSQYIYQVSDSILKNGVHFSMASSSAPQPQCDWCRPKTLYLFIYFNWRLITLQYCGGFCHTLKSISHGYTCVLHPEPHSHLPPHHTPQCCSSAPALSALFHALNLDWWTISHTVIYMFQWHSFKSSHPHLLPQSPKVCSLYLCLFCCLTYKVITTMFINYIYVC